MMKSIADSHAAVIALIAAALLLLAIGCGDTESTNTDKATSTLSPAGAFAVQQNPAAEYQTILVTNKTDGSITTNYAPANNITLLTISAEAAPGATVWNVTATDNTGGAYPGTAVGPDLQRPTDNNTYAAGATIASYALQCANLSGEITTIATVNIPLEVVRTSTTNGTNVVVSRHGQHVITPQNAQHRLTATLTSGSNLYTLTGQAPAPNATMIW